MSKVIQVLAQMASDSSLQTEKAVEVLLINEAINTEQSKAIITKDIISLERQLDICPDIFCLLFPAEDDEAESDSDEEQTNTQSVVNG
tara:strand:+ start:60 stop:323 length:264 start_codon:yes stop_codon:yes gene_type:complete